MSFNDENEKTNSQKTLLDKKDFSVTKNDDEDLASMFDLRTGKYTPAGKHILLDAGRKTLHWSPSVPPFASPSALVDS